MNATPHGLLLFAHGARDPRWAGRSRTSPRACARRGPGMPVALAFLEFMAPDLLDGRRARWPPPAARRSHVVPLFLGAGGHVRKDLPALLERLRAEHPGVHWRLHARRRRDRQRGRRHGRRRR